MKIYLSDGAYAEWSDGELVLTTENGIEITNRVVLDTTGLMVLVRLLNHIRVDPDRTLLDALR